MTRRGKPAERGLGFRAKGWIAQASETARQGEQRAEPGAAGEEMQGIVEDVEHTACAFVHIGVTGEREAREKQAG
jgi:hypothetical protein